MQGYSRVRLLAHRAHYCQVPLPAVTGHVSIRRVHGLEVRAHLLPLLHASGAEHVLALSALFSRNDNHLANAADEVLVKLGIIAFLLCFPIILTLPFFCGVDYPVEGSRVYLHGDILGQGLAAGHDLVDFFVLQYEKAICILFSI